MSDTGNDYNIPLAFVKYNFYMSRNSNLVTISVPQYTFFFFLYPFCKLSLFIIDRVFSHWTSTQNWWMTQNWPCTLPYCWYIWQRKWYMLHVTSIKGHKELSEHCSVYLKTEKKMLSPCIFRSFTNVVCILSKLESNTLKFFTQCLSR